MGVTKHVVREGNGVNFPKKGDMVTIEYTGCLYDESKPGKKGTQFDSRDGFVTKIGVGKVIRGWDEGVITMSLGEKSTLIISSDYAYGDRGFPGRIPPGATLIFDVELKGIN